MRTRTEEGRMRPRMEVIFVALILYIYTYYSDCEAEQARIQAELDG